MTENTETTTSGLELEYILPVFLIKDGLIQALMNVQSFLSQKYEALKHLKGTNHLKETSGSYEPTITFQKREILICV